MEQKFIEMAKTIFLSIDHYRESGRDDKFNIDSIAEYLQREFLLQQTPCTTLLPPDEQRLKDERIWVLEQFENIFIVDFGMMLNPEDGKRILNRLSRQQ